ncbi:MULTISPECIES: extracellular solute-binding protein [Gracilibacillus]|uniref:extracellular solute-binding protein n=1 Tax=Gracilibacillus TaxID=74385 RepID=UPI000825E40F|nr:MULTISPECIES: extracellular solute-binding protein [Gracilibacillus]
MLKHRIIWFALTIITVLFVSACGSDDGDTSTSGEDGPLKVWGMGEEGKKLAVIAEDFEEETGIQVDVQALPWDNAKDKLLTAVASKKGPDILQEPSTWVPQFAESNTYLDLSDYFGNEDYPNLKKENFNESAMKSVELDGKIQAMPWFVAVNALFYRTDILEEEGSPNGPETQEEMLTLAQSLSERGDDQFGLGIPPEDFNLMFTFAIRQGWTYENDKGAENFKKPEFRKMIELYQEIFQNGLSSVQDQGKEPMQALADGSNPMFFSGPYMVSLLQEQAPDIDGQWNVRVVPTAENGDNFIGGTQLAIFHNTNKADKAAQFLNYMADPETQVKWYEASNSLPAVNEAWEDPILAEDEMLTVFQEQMEHTQLPPNIPEYEQLGEQLVNSMEKLIRGTADVDTVMEEYYQSASDILSD